MGIEISMVCSVFYRALGILTIRLQKGRWEATDAVTLLFLNIFTEIYYNSHAKPVYNSRVFSRFTEVCNYNQQLTYSSA